MSDCFTFHEFNYRTPDDVRQPAGCELKVGEQYAMRVDGSKTIRVMLVTAAAIDEHNEMRAHVVVLEDNPYVRAGVECRPLAFTLNVIK